MRVPLSWLRCYVDLPTDSAREAADALLRVGLEVERVESVGADVAGVLVGEVLAIEEFVAGNGKTIRSCQVDAGAGARGIVCAARNFAVGDRVPVDLPGPARPGGSSSPRRPPAGSSGASTRTWRRRPRRPRSGCWSSSAAPLTPGAPPTWTAAPVGLR